MPRRRKPEWGKLGQDGRERIASEAVAYALAGLESGRAPTDAETYGRGPWVNRGRQYGFEWTGGLILLWELDCSPISDDYDAYDMSANELLSMYLRKYQARWPTGLIPIYWSVESPGFCKQERAPFQHSSFDVREDWLSFYQWPRHAVTGELVNWLRLPVVDGQWTTERTTKCGFIQEATGWKPSPLQPFAYVESLSAAANAMSR